jgi:hypothetical protein
MRCLSQMRSLQKFFAVHGSIYNHFNQERAFHSKDNFKLNRPAALSDWRGLCAGQEAMSLTELRLFLIRPTAPNGLFAASSGRE